MTPLQHDINDLTTLIATAREELLEGCTLGFDSASEAAAWMDSL